MDEFFCPNCNAILNEQSGFDPEKDTWTCTKCGQLLSDPEMYDGDVFEGVVWFCDNCGAVLNKQLGFSDTYGSWTCEKCYHSNAINQSEIYESEEDYRNRHDENKISCPECGSNLNEQRFYSEYCNDWECVECGAKLHRNYSFDEYSIIGHKGGCPNCGDKLKNQWGYSDCNYDWVCTECGARLHRDYYSDDFSISEEYEKEDERKLCPNCGESLEEQFGSYPEGERICSCGEVLHFCEECHVLLNEQSGFSEYCGEWTCTECYHMNYMNNNYRQNDDNESFSYNNYTYSSSSYAFDNYNDVGEDKSNIEETKTPNKRKRRWKFRLILTCFIIGICICCYFEFTKLIPVGHSNQSLEGLKYTVVVEKLKESGFSNVRVKEINDLTISREKEEKLVTEVRLGWLRKFDETTRYPSNLSVVVVYHTVETYSPALSSKEVKGMNFQDVVTTFEDAGFTNIKIEVEYDIVTGWVTEDGEVKSVTINGDKKYDSSDKYRLDAEVIVTYHTFIKNKSKK